MPAYPSSLPAKNVQQSLETLTMPIISSADAAAHALPNKYFKSNDKVMQKKRTLAHYQSSFFVRMVGLEPTRGHPRKILSLVRLPFRHIRMCEMFASQQSISYHPPSILSIPFLNFFQEIFCLKLHFLHCISWPLLVIYLLVFAYLHFYIADIVCFILFYCKLLTFRNAFFIIAL